MTRRLSDEEVCASLKELALQLASDSGEIVSVVCAYSKKNNDAHSFILGKTDILPKLVCLLGGAVALDLAEHNIDLSSKDN